MRLPAALTRILVPIDFSPSARAALEYATFLAGKLDAELEVLHVWEPPGYLGPDTLALLPVGSGEPAWEQTRAEVQRELEQQLARAVARPRAFSVRVEAGEPSDTILRLAREGGVDLIVMGTHGRTGLSRLLIGSVAEAVLRRSGCPVLTIRVPTRTSRDAVPL
ncbi:universal stress protein [Anaeromyxobacter oryzisoli]|uniref:universal stress protein n=1 Tax=Anaeromyxobacter oryzisoli TaxID=2925408 RepID=UPI0038CC0315